MLKYIFTLLCALLIPVCKVEARDVSKFQIDSLYAELKEAAYPGDSVMVLYNIFDASTREQQKKMAKLFYSIASRTKDVKLQLDLLRNFGNIFLGNDQAQKLIIEEAEKLPVGPEQRETVMFLKLLRVSTNSMMATPEQRQRYMGETLQKYKNSAESMSAVNQLELLYTLCVYLDATVQGDLLHKYMKDSEEKIAELPFGLYAFRNIYYAHSALMYTRNQEYEAAVNADRKLLGIMDSLEADYQRKGRVFKDFDRNRYICYRRMMYNYPALKSSEIEQLMHRIWNLVANNKELRADFMKLPIAEAFYYMAIKEYVKAKPLIVELLSKNLGGNEYLRLRLSDMLCTVAEATGDKDLYSTALKDYVENLKKHITVKSQERYRELQIIYEMDTLIKENERLEEVSTAARLKIQRVLLIGSLIIGVLLLIGVVVMYNLYRRANNLSKSLTGMNETLKQEGDALKESERQLIDARIKADSAAKIKSDFLDNMTHELLEPLSAITGYTQLIVDSLAPEAQKRLDKYTRLVEMNCDLIHTVVTDAISMSSLASDKLSVVKQKVSLNKICNDAILNVARSQKDGVSLNFLKEDAPDVRIETDPVRVQQVLTSLLGNGIKFTDIGSVNLDYEIDTGAGTITFSVTDTGCGIPEGKEEVIFDRFEKIDSHTQGLGLGLPIARQIAQLLGGYVAIDKKYKGGAGFIFTIPLK